MSFPEAYIAFSVCYKLLSAGVSTDSKGVYVASISIIQITEIE